MIKEIYERIKNTSENTFDLMVYPFGVPVGFSYKRDESEDMLEQLEKMTDVKQLDQLFEVLYLDRKSPLHNNLAFILPRFVELHYMRSAGVVVEELTPIATALVKAQQSNAGLSAFVDLAIGFYDENFSDTLQPIVNKALELSDGNKMEFVKELEVLRNELQLIEQSSVQQLRQYLIENEASLYEAAE